MMYTVSQMKFTIFVYPMRFYTRMFILWLIPICIYACIHFVKTGELQSIFFRVYRKSDRHLVCVLKLSRSLIPLITVESYILL